MKVVGLITEYNPFHNGHKYHIEEAKKVTGADYAIVIMSGNFVQRGAPAILDKYSRTQMALNNGADIVIELPVCYATGSAEYFSYGAVSILDKLGIVDYLCFGSETGNIDNIMAVSKLLLNHTSTLNPIINQLLKEGSTYPAARSKAMEYLIANNKIHLNDFNMNLLLKPNNILGIEYCKALIHLSSTIIPMTIQRITADYHAKTLSSVDDLSPIREVISSATAIRNSTMEYDNADGLTSIERSVPRDVFQYMKSNFSKKFPITEEDFASIIKYKLLSEDRHALVQYVDINEDLADRLKNWNNFNCSIDQLTNAIKTKNVTRTRVNRALIHMLLNIKKESFLTYNNNGYASYARILGIKKASSHLLRRINNKGKIPVITKVSKAIEQLDSIGLQMLSEDIFATHLYNQIVYEKYATIIENEYKHGIVLL